MVTSWLAVFAAMALLDFIWAEYTSSVADGRAHRASATAVVIIFVSGFVTTSYVADRWLLIPAGLGAYAGTYLSIQWKRWRS